MTLRMCFRKLCCLLGIFYCLDLNHLIFDGSFSEIALVGIYCNGNEPPPSVTTVSDVMLIQFYSDDSVEHTGFNITYSIIDDPCRVALSSTEGSLGTVGLDRNSDDWYERGLDCLWNITTDNGSVVHLKFLSMDIPVDQNSSLCGDAHIKVYDGSLDEDALIETLCGTVVPPKITSSSSMLFVSFYSHKNSTHLGNGFEALFSQFDGTVYYECGETLNDTRGWFSLPADRGDSLYRNNLNCTWTIMAGTGSNVQVVFENIDIENSGTTCEYDYLQLYDGDSPVGTFCNSHPPPNMITKSDTLHVRFISDSSVRGGGFNATYLMIDGLLKGCGRFLVNSTGYIESPDSDNDGQYDQSVDCRWTIVGAENNTVELKMLKFDLEQDAMCSYDFLKVYDGLSEQDTLIGVFCGDTSVPRIQSSGAGLVLHFFSDASITGGGFYAAYGHSSGTSYDCGGILTGPRGQFSPSGSERAGFYDNELDCQWTIMAEHDMILHLLFLNIDVESDTMCRYDFIKVYNGDISERSLVGTFCGFSERKKVVSSTVLYVLFHSDASVTKTGFRALYASAGALERRRWPPGDYSLPMSRYGCPDPDVNDWKFGYINITIEYPSDRSFSHYLMGPFGEKSYQLTFCTMTLSNDPYDHVTAEWPPDSYTIYGGKSGCPAEFNERAWEGRYGGVYRHVANGHLPKVELDWGAISGGTLPGFGYDVLRIMFTLCDARFSTDEQIHRSRFPFVVLKSEANLDTNTAMEGISLNPAVRVITNMADEQFGLYPLIMYLPKDTEPLFFEITQNNQSKVTTWALGLPDQTAEDMAWVLYDLGVSVAVTSLRFLNMKTDLNATNETMPEIPSVLLSERKWSFLRYGSYHCFQHKTVSASRIDVYCLNKPSGRYLVFLSESIEQRELFNMVLTRSWAVWINSDKVSPRCNQALGMQDGSIQDFQLSASTIYPDHPAYNGRPGRNGWCTRPDDSNSYIQVGFITPTVVEGFQIFNVLADPVLHENSGYETFIKGLQSFAFSYSNDAQPGSFIEKEQYTLDPTLPFNYGHTVLFTEPTLARYWRMRPLTQEWRNRDKSGKKCFNIEIFGCLQIGTKSIHCAERNDSNWFSSRNMWITQYHGPPRTLFHLNTSQECSIACEEMSSYCSVIAYYREAQTCEWYEESPSYSYMTYSVNSDETLIRLCSDGSNATYRQTLSHLLDWDATTTIINTPGAVVSQGFPFNYFRGEVWRWIVSFPNETYANLILFNLSFDRSDVSAEDGVSAARYSDKSDRLYLATTDFDENKVFTDNVIQKEDGIQYIFDRDDNDMFFHYNFNVERLVLILRTTLLQSLRTDHGVGFRLLVYSTDLPPCFPHGICKEESALIRPDCYLGDFVNYFEAIWTIQMSAPHYVTLSLESFDVGCETGSSFQVQFILGSLKKFCNNDKRIGTIASVDPSLTIKFRLNRIAGSLIEQFSALYHANTQNTVDVSFTEGAVDIAPDGSSVRQATKVCSWQFGKCYILLDNLADFGENDLTGWSYTWSDICEGFGWSMLSLHSKLEQDFIAYILLQRFYHVNNGFCYIGLERKITPTGDYIFSWLDGSPVTFTAWATGHPSPSLGGCTRLRLAWSEEVSWESIPCYEDLAAVAVCEYYNRTGSVALLDTDIKGTDLRNSRWLNRSSDIPTHAQLSSYFFCGGNELISLLGVCNGNRDCLNGEDETDCPESQDTCDKMQFRCGDGQCVTISVLCDHYDDCVDHSDEDCYFPSCEADQFRCDNSKCIDGDQRCDGKLDCNDESDEKNCILDNCNNENSFLCGLSKCLPRVYVCDGMADCPDGRDEENCEKPRTCQQWWDAGYTQSGSYIVYGEEMECDFESIKANNTVITRYYKIDHGRFVTGAVGSTLTYQDTGGLIDMYKENQCYQSIDQLCQPWIQIQFDIDKTITGASNHRCRCVRYIVPLSNVSNSSTILECSSDERSPVDSESFHLTMETSAIFRHIETMRVKLDHSFNTDEMRILINPITCFSDFQSRGQGIACGNGFTTASDNRCLYSLDQFGHISGCRSLEHLQNCASYVCPSDYFKCPDSFCLETRFVCDGIRQCQRGEDEANCATKTCSSLYRCLEASICLPLHYLCDGYRHCPLGDDERLCNFKCPDECVCHGFAADCTGQYANNNTTFLNSPTTRWLDISYTPRAMNLLSLNEQNLQYLVHLNVSYCQIANITDSLLKFMKNLLVLDIRYNNLKVVNPETFVNQERLRVLHLAGNFEILTLEPQAFKGLNSLSEMKLSHLRLGRISRAAFASLQLKTLELSENIIYFMENNAFETLVVENIYLNGSDILSFSHDMFKGIESVDTIASDAFKFCCVRPDFMDEEDCYPHKDEFSSCAYLMRNEVLRALIWVIGAFALLGNCFSLLYRFIYDRKRLKLGYGIFVSNLAISDFLMGVYLFIIASADVSLRGEYIFNSDAWKNSAWCNLAGVLSALSSEASVLFMCLITLDRILVTKFPFGQIRITPKVAGALVSVVWLIAFLIALLPILHTSYFKDEFYSKSGVCLALPLTRDKPPGWAYSVGLFIGFNSVTFLLIALGQILIYREINASKMKMKNRHSSRSNDLRVARNLLLVVSTDFLCWFPIGILGVLALTDHVIPSDVYAWTAVIILPINSALNPFLYTLSAIISKKKFAPDSTEQTRLEVFTKVDFDHVLQLLWDNGDFVKPYKKSEMVPLKCFLEKKRADPFKCVAISIACLKRLQTLYDTGLVQQKFGIDDIYMRRNEKKRVRVVLSCRPEVLDKHKPAKKNANIEAFGFIVSTLIQHCYTEKKPQQGGSKTKCS